MACSPCLLAARLSSAWGLISREKAHPPGPLHFPAVAHPFPTLTPPPLPYPEASLPPPSGPRDPAPLFTAWIRPDSVHLPPPLLNPPRGDAPPLFPLLEPHPFAPPPSAAAPNPFLQHLPGEAAALTSAAGNAAGPRLGPATWAAGPGAGTTPSAASSVLQKSGPATSAQRAYIPDKGSLGASAGPGQGGPATWVPEESFATSARWTKGWNATWDAGAVGGVEPSFLSAEERKASGAKPHPPGQHPGGPLHQVRDQRRIVLKQLRPLYPLFACVAFGLSLGAWTIAHELLKNPAVEVRPWRRKEPVFEATDPDKAKGMWYDYMRTSHLRHFAGEVGKMPMTQGFFYEPPILTGDPVQAPDRMFSEKRAQTQP